MGDYIRLFQALDLETLLRNTYVYTPVVHQPQKGLNPATKTCFATEEFRKKEGA